MNAQSSWGFLFRVMLKAALLFGLCNAVFALLSPLETLGRVSLYNALLPGRLRLPYGENSAQSYNVSLNNIPAMLTSHVVSRPKAADEYRVLLNAANLVTADGRRLVVYNLGYPILSLTKDLLLLDAAMEHRPDLVVWPVTLESFPRRKQVASPIIQNNAGRVRRLIAAYRLALDPNDGGFVDPDFFGRTLVGQRRALADWLRLQLYGFAWAATGVDQDFPDEVRLRQSDLDADVSWQSFGQPATLTEDDLAFDVLAAGVARAGNTPVLIVNEPMFVSAGRNSNVRYNAFYPRWAYDRYRELLRESAASKGWHYLDLWNRIARAEFTDTPVHLTPDGTAQFAEMLGPAILQLANRGRLSSQP